GAGESRRRRLLRDRRLYGGAADPLGAGGPPRAGGRPPRQPGRGGCPGPRCPPPGRGFSPHPRLWVLGSLARLRPVPELAHARRQRHHRDPASTPRMVLGALRLLLPGPGPERRPPRLPGARAREALTLRACLARDPRG